MIKITVIETREKNKLFSAILNEVKAKEPDISISWINQNPAFSHNLPGSSIIIPFPEKARHAFMDIPDYINQTLRICDRSVKVHDDYNGWFFGYYYKKIRESIEFFQPDIVFGEVGNFHSHIASMVCEELGIVFLNPLLCRYPVDRFSFYLYDKFIPFGGENKYPSDEILNLTLNKIVHRSIIPEYMKKQRRSRIATYLFKANVHLSRLRGEQFNTKSLSLILKHSRLIAFMKKRWERQQSSLHTLSQVSAQANHIILYPLQLQPELNIDVWGRCCNNQLDIIKEIHSSIKDKDILIIKANPKFFLEVSEKLLDFQARNSDKIYLAPIKAPMADIEAIVDEVFTVTGTIAIERTLSKKPVTILCEEYRNFLTGDTHTPFDLMKKLYKTSYKGLIAEPTFYPSVMSKQNLQNLATAFLEIIKKIKNQDK